MSAGGFLFICNMSKRSNFESELFCADPLRPWDSGMIDADADWCWLILWKLTIYFLGLEKKLWKWTISFLFRSSRRWWRKSIMTGDNLYKSSTNTNADTNTNSFKNTNPLQIQKIPFERNIRSDHFISDINLLGISNVQRIYQKKPSLKKS